MTDEVRKCYQGHKKILTKAQQWHCFVCENAQRKAAYKARGLGGEVCAGLTQHVLSETGGRTGNGRCVACLKEGRVRSKQRAEELRFCSQGHDTKIVGRTKGRECKECKRIYDKKWYQLEKLGLNKAKAETKRNEKRVREHVDFDGWEEEFGSVPAPVLDEDWVDWVVLLRASVGDALGRPLTSAEIEILQGETLDISDFMVYSGFNNEKRNEDD